MRKLLLLSLLLASGLCLAEPQSINIDRSHAVALELPKGWTLTLRPTSPELPMRAAMVSNDKDAFKLTISLISPYSDLARATDKDKMLGEMLGHIVENDLAQSQEGKATIRDLGGSGTQGKYVQLSNKTYDVATAKPGEFHYLTTALLQVGDLLVNVRYVSNSLDDGDYQAGLDILRSLHSQKP